MRATALAVLVLASGCLRATAFPCSSDTECVNGVQGTCEAIGYCSFPDPSCSAGSRFGEGAGSHSNQCVGETGGDAGVTDADGDGADGAADAAPDAASACPATYLSINGSAHRYLLRPDQASWAAQRTACMAEGAYLVVPDDMSELEAIATLTSNNFWVGITDQADEGSFVTVLGAPAMFLPWDNGQPDNSGNSDCVAAVPSLEYRDQRCFDSIRAICECEP